MAAGTQPVDPTFSSFGYVVPLAVQGDAPAPNGGCGGRFQGISMLSDPGKDCPALHFLGPVPLRFVLTTIFFFPVLLKYS